MLHAATLSAARLHGAQVWSYIEYKGAIYAAVSPTGEAADASAAGKRRVAVQDNSDGSYVRWLGSSEGMADGVGGGAMGPLWALDRGSPRWADAQVHVGVPAVAGRRQGRLARIRRDQSCRQGAKADGIRAPCAEVFEH